MVLVFTEKCKKNYPTPSPYPKWILSHIHKKPANKPTKNLVEVPKYIKELFTKKNFSRKESRMSLIVIPAAL